MSRIGIRPIKIEEGVTLDITPSRVVASCGSNKLELGVPKSIKIEAYEGFATVKRSDDSKESRSLHGLTARLLMNIIHGVKEGFVKELEYKGTGYRASTQGNEIILNMGYSHEIKIEIPEGLEVKIAKSSIVVSGIEKDKVGALAAKIREVRSPEVYKGKGIKYKEEFIKRKAGKTAASK